jgi:hypothetical protein
LLSVTTAQLISAWEKGLAEHPVDRALTLLAVAHPSMSREELALLSIGERDAGLLALREALFGNSLNSVAQCPKCGVQLEFSIPLKQLHREEAATASRCFELTADDLHLRFRAPNSNDLSLATKCADVASARRLLSNRCVVEAKRAGEDVSAAEIPEEVIGKLSTAIASADAGCDHVIQLSCEECSHHWQLVIDIPSYLWEEINRLAKRLLQQVHILAWAYGWREADILSMSSARREFYLELVS